MAIVQYNLSNLFREAFGIAGRFPLYNVEGTKLIDAASGHKSEQTGVFMWDLISLKLPALDDSIDSLKANSIGGVSSRFLMPDTTLVHAQKSKDIVKTKVAGRDGTVKELISDGDWAVTFQGFIINNKQPGKYPDEKVKAFRELVKLKVAITAVSKYLNNLGIFDIVIEGCDFPPLEGYPDVQPFQLNCVSDTPVILELNNNDAMLAKLKNVPA